MWKLNVSMTRKDAFLKGKEVQFLRRFVTRTLPLKTYSPQESLYIVEFEIYCYAEGVG